MDPVRVLCPRVRGVRRDDPALRRRVGRDLDGVGWHVWLFTNVQAAGDVAREASAAFMVGNCEDIREIVDHVAAAGTAREVAERFKAYVDAGARHFVFMIATSDDDEAQIRWRLLDECIPSVREHAARHVHEVLPPYVRKFRPMTGDPP